MIGLLTVHPLPLFAQSSAAVAPSILVYGDSLSAAYGLARTQGWATLLQDRLKAKGFRHQVNNRSLSGETTFGGRQRFLRVLDQTKPSITILALGANDALRGLSLEQTRQNLAFMIEQSLARKSAVLLVGIQLPPNYGPVHNQRLQAVFKNLATTTPIGFVPFMLEGFATDESYFQPDRIHPNAKAQPKILDTLWPAIEQQLQSTEGPHGSAL
ncbi:MAG: acyl-CoA thioesterase protein [Pseudomonadota bacterium]